MNARVEQQVYNQCITILKLKDKYSSQTLERASGIIIEKNITPIHRNFKAVIENIQEVKEKTYIEKLEEEVQNYESKLKNKVG